MALMQLDKYKSAGVYQELFDKSAIISTNNDINRLVVGFSKRGPFNVPVFVPNTEFFIDVFGGIDKQLERRKSFFHRTCLTALEKGPIIALNILKLTENDNVDSFIYSTSSTEGNIGLSDQKYSGYYNTEKFWYPDDDAFLNNIASEPTNKRLFNLVNIGQKPLSTIVRKTPIESLTGFQVTVKEWYGVDDLPEFLHGDDLISDFFIDVIVLQGDFGASTTDATPYERFSTDPNLSKYFDNTKGVKRKKTASDESDTLMDEFLNLSEVNNIASYRGILIPDFQDKNGNNIFIETIINRQTEQSGLFCAIDKDVFANGDLLSGIDGGIDLVGHNLEYAQPKKIDFLSYKETIKSDLEYDAVLPVLDILDLASVTISDSSSGNATFTINKVDNEIAYSTAWEFIANELSPRQIGTYLLSDDSTVFGALTNIVKTQAQIYFEIEGISASNFTASDVRFMNSEDINFVYDDVFTYESYNVGKIVASANSELYADAQSGILVNGDKIQYGFDGSTPGYLTFEFRNDFTELAYDLAGTKTVATIAGNYTLPIVNVTAHETNDYLTYVDQFGFGLNFYDSDGVENTDATLIAQTLKGSLNNSVVVTRTENINEVEIDLSEGYKFSVKDYVVADDGALSGNSRLTKIYKIVNLGDKLKLITYGRVSIKNVNGLDTIEVYKPVTEWVDYYSIQTLKGFKHSKEHMPNGTNQRQNDLLYSVLSGTALYKALVDRENISFRYLVDSFGNGIEASSKSIFSSLAKERGDCLAILNAPSFKDFKNSTEPEFTDIYGSVDARLISQGGDLSKNPEEIYSLPSIIEGSSYAAFYGPYIKVRDNSNVITVPPAAFVSNLFMDKYSTSLPWAYVAGSRRGVISGRGVLGVETNLSKSDRDYLEPFGYNPIIYQNNVGIVIYGDKTAQQNIKSALSSVHVREALIYIQKGIEGVLKNFIFEFNTAQNRLQIKSLADNFLERVKQNDGVYDYKNVMDTTNNTADIIDNNMGILDTYVEPVRGLELLVHRTTVLKTGAIASGNFQ